MLTKEQKEKYLRILSKASCNKYFDSGDIETMHEIMRFIQNEPEFISREQFDKIFKIERLGKVYDYPVKDCSTTKYRLVTDLENNIVLSFDIDEEEVKDYIKEYINNLFFDMINKKLGE